MGALICLFSLLAGFGLGFILYPKVFTDYNRHANVVEKATVLGPAGEMVISIDVNNLKAEELPDELKLLKDANLSDTDDNVLIVKSGDRVRVESYHRGILEITDMTGRYIAEVDYHYTDLIRHVAQHRLDKKFKDKN